MLGDLYFVKPNAKMNFDMYINVLQKHLRGSMKKTGTKLFQQDGTPCHKSRRVMAWLRDHDVVLLEWVGQSCDCNPIENLWDRLKSIIRKYNSLSNLNELAKNIRRGWKRVFFHLICVQKKMQGYSADPALSFSDMHSNSPAKVILPNQNVTESG